jgi:hypothetical protein
LEGITSCNVLTSSESSIESTSAPPSKNAKLVVNARGGGGGGKDPNEKKPSFYWAVLHNWMYFLSLGFNLINVPFMIRRIVDGEGATSPSPAAIALSGKVESTDKFLTFLGVGFLSALSDKFGRKPLMAWSAIGFMITNLIQAQTKSSVAMLYLADVVDGCTSCMLPLCQTYVTDCSTPDKRAANLGIFQGLSGTYVTCVRERERSFSRHSSWIIISHIALFAYCILMALLKLYVFSQYLSF